MRRWSCAEAVVLTLAMVAVAGAPAAAAERAQKKATCQRSTQGAVSIGTVSVRTGGSRGVVLDQTTTYDADTGRLGVQAIARQGQQFVFGIEQTLDRDGTAEGMARYGRGFKGVAEISFTKSGSTGQMIIDGRPTAPIAIGSDARAVRFADGSPLPRLRTRAATRKALLKLARQASTGCPEAAVAAAQVAFVQPVGTPYAGRPEGSFACKKCEARCAGAWIACLTATFGNPYAAAVATGLALFGKGKPTCIEASVQCLDDCHNKEGEACCPVKCGGRCWEEGAKCCGSLACTAGDRCADPRTGTCCTTDSGDACGTGCCPQGHRCAGTGVCCPNGSGEYCGVLGCCAGGQRCFVSYDEETGTLLGRVCCDKEPCGYNTCCPQGTTCVAPETCATPNQICSGGTYCPLPGVCLPNGSCCQGGQVCGDQCCNAFGATCCNGQCCNGQCIGGACCPSNNACGPACCPNGYACADPAQGSCVPCRAGEEACPFSPGSLITCCPSGRDCCVGGCCAAGLQCCRPPGSSQVGCHQSFECVR